MINFQNEAEQQKTSRQMKNKAHQLIVKEQMKEESRMFAKTGIAIINSAN